jgi:hypothetical protein
VLAAELPAQGTAWDRPAVAPSAAHHDSQAIWGNIRSTWTSTDESRGTPSPSQSRQPAAPPSPPGLWQTLPTAPAMLSLPGGQAMESRPLPATSGTPPVPAPEAVIRSALQPLLPPPPTATSVLRGNVPPRPATAAGIARTLSPPVTVPQARTAISGLGPAPNVPLEPQTPTALAPNDGHALPPEPADVTMRHALHQEERVYPLFDIPTDAGARIDRQSAERIGSLFDTSPRPLIPHTAPPQRESPLALRDAPPASLEGSPVGDAVGRATANLDGLDAVPKSTPPHRTPYEPVPLQQIRPTHDYSPEGIPLCPNPEVRCPPERGLPLSLQPAERSFPQIDFLWVPTNVFYGPLYFEDPALERYGHSHGPLLQSLASPSRFALQFVSLPYQMALDPPHRRVYPLGFYRPGDYAPKQVPNVPLNAEAAVTAGAVYTGLIFAFP